MKLFNETTLESVATQYINKPDYVITDGWNTDYITVDYINKTWQRSSDYFKLSESNKKDIEKAIFKTSK
jgi:hypothetical protein